MKNLKKVKSILRIDDDLAQNMRDEINGVKRSGSDYEDKVEVEKDKSMSGGVMVDSSLLDQVERLKKVCPNPFIYFSI